MGFRYHKHYTLEEARALLPQIHVWLNQLDEKRRSLAEDERSLGVALSKGSDLGGSRVNRSIRTLAEIQELIREFEWRQIQIKDLDRGLLDFPAIMEGREVFLCWERGEEDIEFWHDLDAGYAGREPLL